MNNYVATDTFEYNGEAIEFNYFTRFNMSNRVAFIDAVVESIVGESETTTEDEDGNKVTTVNKFYYPMLKDMIFDYQLMLRFSDVVMTDYVGDIDNLSNGELIDTIEKFMNETNIGTIMKLGIDIDELNTLIDGVDKAIEYKTGIHPSPIADGIASLLDTVEKKFAGIDMDSMKDMANVFGKLQGNITPEKMLEAYAKSDVFKQQRDEVVEKQAKRDAAMEKVRENVKKNTSSLLSLA